MSVLVISDIDGTLVPHPFSSGVSLKDRAHHVERVGKLFKHKNFGLVTGRTRAGVKRLFSESGMESSEPYFLGVEFAAHLYQENKALQERPQDKVLVEIKELLDTELARFGEAIDFLGPNFISNGRLSGYFMELKSAMLQIEWDLGSAQKDAQFNTHLSYLLNPYLRRHEIVYTQVYANRLDLVSANFIPKQKFWKYAEKSFKQAMTPKPALYLLGDELYDAYMFEEFIKLHKGEFSEIHAISVGRELPFATRQFANATETLTFVENLLNSK